MKRALINQLNEAIDNCDRAINLNPSNDSAWNNRGSDLYALGQYQDALDSFDRAVALKLNEKLYWTNRGNALRRLGQLENALASYSTALTIDPSNSQTKDLYNNVLQAIEHQNTAGIGARLQDRGRSLVPHQTSVEPNQSATNLVHTVDRDGNPFEYQIKDIYPDEDSYRYITNQSKKFEEILPELIAEHGGKYIVFEDGRVIDSDESEDVLLDRLWETDFIKDRMGINGHGIYCHLVPKQL